MTEVVIKIPDEVLSFVYQNGFIKEEDRNTVHHAMLECVELPKGHGRLIDADAVLEEPIGNTYKDIDIAETIIEADKQ